MKPSGDEKSAHQGGVTVVDVEPHQSPSDNETSDDNDSENGSSSSSGEDADDDDERAWVDADEGDNTNLPLCLFCPGRHELDLIMQHMLEAHQFSLDMVLKKYNMDQVSFIKMVNWLRHLGKTISLNNIFENKEQDLKLMVIRAVLFDRKDAVTTPPWEDNKWLEPSIPNDMLLTFCCNVEEDEDCEDIQRSAANVPVTVSPILERLLKGDCDGARPRTRRLSNSKINPLMDTDRECVKLIDGMEDRMKALEEENLKMKEIMKRVLGDINRKSTSEKSGCSNDSPLANEEEYFDSYDSVDIHAEMLKDYPRTLAYKRAIQNNSNDFAQKTVLDLGSGTGILSMFCADAGAKTVFAVDCSKMLYDAMDICYENNQEGKITFLSSKLESIPKEEITKVDILISEFMGYFLLFEGMTNSYLYARDHFLKPDGKMFPNSANMYIVAISDEDDYKNNVEIWSNIHGYKMTALKKKVLVAASVQSVEQGDVASEEVIVKKLDLHTCQVGDLIIDDGFELFITKNCALTSICGYFSVGFEDGTSHKEILTTAPGAPLTHWNQTIFYLPEKMDVSQGDKIPCKFSCKPHPDFERWLKIDLQIGKHSCSYDMK